MSGSSNGLYPITDIPSKIFAHGNHGGVCSRALLAIVPRQPRNRNLSVGGSSHERSFTRCRVGANNTSPVVMTLISGSLSSYDDPLARKIDPAPTVFNVLRLLHAALGVALIVSPAQVLSIAYSASPGNSLVSSLVMLLGGIHLYGSLFAHALKSASENSRLSSNTYKCLAFGLGAWSFASMMKIAFLSSGSAQLSLVSSNVYAALFAFTLGAQFVCAKGQQINFVPWNPLRLNVVENVYGFGIVFALLSTLAVWVQCLCPESFLGTQLSHLSWIHAPAGALGKELLQFLSTGGFLLLSAFNVLLDGSQRGRLGASTFKLLNLGTGLISALWGFCLYRLFTDGTMTNLIFGDVFTSFASYKGHLMDIFTYKALILIFPLLGVACFIQYLIAKK
jgi:hypothetical protein